jgi:hypothetical protein
MCEPEPVQVPDNVIHKTIVLEPGQLGIEFVTNEPERNGLILKVKDNAQASFHEEGITKGCKIIKLDEEEYTHDLLKIKKGGNDCYCMEISCPSQMQLERDNVLMNFIRNVDDSAGNCLIKQADDSRNFSDKFMNFDLKDNHFGTQNSTVIDKIETNNDQDNKIEPEEKDAHMYSTEEDEEDDSGKIVDTKRKRDKLNKK